MVIDSKGLLEEQAHSLLKSCIVPRPVAWISTKSPSGIGNLAPYSCFTFVATKPPMICFSIGRRKDGRMKDTLANILNTHEFVVHIVSDSYAAEVTQTAAEIPPDKSEWDLVSVKPVSASQVHASRIESAPVSMECRLHQTVELGESHHTLVIGEIQLFHIEDSFYRDGEVDVRELRPLSRLSGDLFAKLGEIFEVKRQET